MAEFAGKVVLISGAARGQGAADARLLVAHGAKVVIGDVRDAAGHALADELGGGAVFVHHDVTNPADWAAAAVRLAESLSGLHGLVNNAGIFQPVGLADTDIALWESHCRINQFGCFLGMKEAAPAMQRSGGGSIVNISSVAGMRGSQQAFAYCATKWALRGMTRSAAGELAGRNIRVNCICPGLVDTDMLDRWTPDERRARIGAVPMNRMGTPQEIAELVMFLLSDRSSYITGVKIAADGGLVA